jgi:hypothetical protein
MSSRKLDVGTIVHFLGAGADADSERAEYRIEQLLLMHRDDMEPDGSILYRIRCDAEPFDRVVAETDFIRS